MLRILIPIIYFGVTAGCGCPGTNQVYVQHRAPITGWYTHVPNEEAFELVVGEVNHKVVSYKLVYLKETREWSMIHYRSPKVTDVFTWNATSGNGDDVENVKIFCPVRCTCRKVHVEGPWCMRGYYGRSDVVEQLREDDDRILNEELHTKIQNTPELLAIVNEETDTQRQEDSPVGFPMQDDNPMNFPMEDDIPGGFPMQGDNPLIFPMQDEDPMKFPMQDEDPLKFPKRDEDPLKFPMLDESPLNFPMLDEDPFKFPKHDEDPFKFPKHDEDPFKFPMLDEEQMNFPKHDEDPFKFPMLDENPLPFSMQDDDSLSLLEQDHNAEGPQMLPSSSFLSEGNIDFLQSLSVTGDSEYSENHLDANLDYFDNLSNDPNYLLFQPLEPLLPPTVLQETISMLDQLASCVSLPSTSPTGFCAAGTRPAAPSEAKAEVSRQDNDTDDDRDVECIPDEYIFMDQAIYRSFKISRAQGHLWWIGISDHLSAVSDEGAPCLDELPDYTQWLTVSEKGTLEPNRKVSVRCVLRDPP